MAVALKHKRYSLRSIDNLLLDAASELRFTEQSMAFGNTHEVGVGMIFPIQENGTIFGKGYYQLSQQEKHNQRTFHQPVMVDEVLFWLLVDLKGTYVDCTIGGGGHAAAMLHRLSSSAKLLGMDRDDEAIKAAAHHLEKWKNQITLKQDNFAGIESFLDEKGIEQVDGVLMDLGVSAHQIETDYRGFSFSREGPLDMRMNRRQKVGAFHVVNNYPERELRRIIREYGEERKATLIAKEIVRSREAHKIDSTTALVKIVEKVVHPGILNKTLARVFQSLRIEVNSELSNVRLGLEAVVDRLKPGARLVVLTYHSLEDRIVKHFFQENVGKCICPPEFPKCVCNQVGKLRILTRKPIVPSKRELSTNPKSRSAKLRVAERI